MQDSIPYEAVCEASSDAIVLVDADGRIRYANGRVADMFGYDPDDLVGDPVEVLVPETDREAHVAQRDEYLADPEMRPMGVDLDLHARRSDGSTFPVDIGLSPLAVDGEQYVMATVRDITDRATLRAKHRAILEGVPDPVVVADATTGEIIEVNERAADLLGRDPEELVGRPQTALHPSEERERYRELFERHVGGGAEIVTHHPDGSDVLVETADGERVPVEINARVFERGDRRLTAGVFRDVSDRRERERRLKSLHEATRDLVTASSRECIAERVAAAANTILGHPSTVVRLVADGEWLRPVAVTDQAQADLGERPDYPLSGDNPAARAFERGEPVRYADVGDLDDGYDRGDVRSAAYLPVDDHGVISIVSTELDAFDRTDVELASILAANAEVALDRREYQRQLERQTERLDEFAGIVSHDLRNPLNVARGRLAMVREEAANDDAVADADLAVEALDRMEAIIEDTLTLARRGDVVDDPEPVAVADLAATCWRMVDTDDARLEVVDEFRIRGDRSRLQHLFENLFRNAVEHGSTSNRPQSGDAVEHGSAGSPPPDGDSVERGSTSDRPEAGDDATGDEGVTVRVGTLDAGGFYVEDDGPGVPAEVESAVFDPGYTSTDEGTGLGLTIVERIAEAHGWSVRLTDAASGGARFEFTDVDVV
ncbi:MAG: PAS domain-containing sensor histidine kinase [Haloferacaceae archaeon]